MIHPNNDRLDYGQLVAPPDGYALDLAVGTTYSLDLDALVGICLALGLSAETDTALANNPVFLLEALRTTGDKITLFCEGGQIYLPGNVTPLYILLEKMVYQTNAARRRRNTRYPSFHPKFWLIRYVDKKAQPRYRVVVLSRNLTFDRSWDVAFSMDGIKEDTATEKNEPIIDFLTYLTDRMPSKADAKLKQKNIRKLMKELPFIHFAPNAKAFYDYDFIPVGIPKRGGGYHTIIDYPLFTEKHQELLVMSPFLSNDVIKALHDKNPSLGPDAQVLITRAMSLGRLKPQDCHRFSVYTLKDAIVDGETAISDDGAQPQKQDIHAKLYMTRRYSDTDLYLGSLNASHNAISGNVEFMIRLRTKNRYLNLQKLTADIFGNQADGKDNPFAPACVEAAVADEDQERLHRLDQVVKEIAHTQPNACVMANTDRYDIMVSFSITSYPYEVSISPLLSGRTEKLAEQVVFSGLSVTQLSEFYKVSVSDGGQTIRRILVIPTQGLPEDREKTVISNVIHDQSCFYRYIAFLLGDSVELGALELAEMTRTGSAGTSSNAPSMPALYEKMLKAAASSPEKLKEIDHLIRAVSDDGVIPEYFEQLYETFRKAVKLDG